MNGNHPAQQNALSHEVVGVVPQTFEPGVYVSKANLPSPTEEAEVIASYENDDSKEKLYRSIGMAAIPEEYVGQQLTSLVYNGMTSEQYAEQHSLALAEFAQTEQQQLQAQIEDFVGDIDKEEGEDEEDSDKDRKGSHPRHDVLVGASK